MLVDVASSAPLGASFANDNSTRSGGYIPGLTSRP